MTTPNDSARLFRYDMVLLALVLALAFLLGSFTATNGDVFLHLSLGNPFGNNADSSGWVHHAWLTSLLLGAVYEPLSASAAEGGSVAVIAKALVVVALAVVMCLIRRRGQSWLVPIACTALAVLVMSPRLLLQPQVISLLFLAVTLLILTLADAGHSRMIWWLPALFALWVNMDQWFVLGPLIVGLWVVGETLQIRFGGNSDGQLKRHALVLALGVAACLVNPWFHRALTLPMDLAFVVRNVLPAGLVSAGQMVGKVTENDPQFIQLISPFSSDYWSRPSNGRHTAGLAYFVLLLLDIVSFALVAFLRVGARSPQVVARSPDRATAEVTRSGDHVTTWGKSDRLPLLVTFLFFALLSALNWRMIPLFAVVGGPIAALNFQDYLGRLRAPTDSPARSVFNYAQGSRVVALVACLLLLACAWPGWLHPNAGHWRITRHAAWDIAEDPRVLEAAKVIRQVQEQTGLCRLGFNYSVDGGNTFAYCRSHGEPTVQVFFDSRYALPSDKAEALGKIRKALRDEANAAPDPQPKPLANKVPQGREIYQQLMRRQGIDYVVLTGLHFDQQSLKIADSLLVDRYRQWVLLYLDGRTAVFGWLDPANKASEAYRKVRLDVYRLAPTAKLPPNMPHVVLDAHRVASPPSDTSGDWHAYLYGPTRPSLSSFQSAHLLALCKQVAGDWQRGNIDLMVAGWGAPSTLASDATTKGPVIFRKDPQGKPVAEPLFKAKDRMPAGALILAVRAGRQATLENPNDVDAYLALGQAYELCRPQEDYWAGRPPARPRPLYRPELRVQFRMVQIINAFQNALMVQPENVQVHDILHELYLNMGYLDLALEHLAGARKGMDSRVPASAEQAAAFQQLKEKYDQRLKALGDEVTRRKEAYTLEASGQQIDAVSRFQLALVNQFKEDAQGRDQKSARGLVKLGLQLLLDANFDSFKDDPIKMHSFASWELYLLLTTGQAREAAAGLENKKLRGVLGLGEYEEMQALAAAALGDYAAADKFLEQAEKARELPPDEQILDDQRKFADVLAEHLASSAAWTPAGTGHLGPLSRLGVFYLGMNGLLDPLTKMAKERRDVAELRLIRGSLALESGDTAAAAKHFRASLAILPLILPLALDFTDRPIAQRYLELLEAK